MVGEIVLCFLAALGGAGLLWLLGGRLLLPWRPGVCWVIAARGKGETLEHTLRGVLWLRRGELCPRAVLIADCGLDPEGAALAAALAEEHQGVCLVPGHRLGAKVERLLSGPEEP